MAITDRNLQSGTRLVTNYKKQPFVCTVEAEEDRKLAFVLEDGSGTTALGGGLGRHGRHCV